MLNARATGPALHDLYLHLPKSKRHRPRATLQKDSVLLDQAALRIGKVLVLMLTLMMKKFMQGRIGLPS
jgi:hypothetical protein